MRILRERLNDPRDPAVLRLDAPLVVDWLVKFLRYECTVRRQMSRVVLGLSGGVDSAVVAFLCARAFAPEDVYAFMLPYRLSSASSLADATLVADSLGIRRQTIEISEMVDGYAKFDSGMTPARLGNVCARARMIVLFDQSARVSGLPIGTGNKTERLFGYYTWHADDAPPINPLGDLMKTQVWQIADYLGVPERIVKKPASADLVAGQTDENDFGISYARADMILHYLVQGYDREKVTEMGFDARDVEIVWNLVARTHWKRRLPTVAMLTASAIGESYLRPVDY